MKTSSLKSLVMAGFAFCTVGAQAAPPTDSAITPPQSAGYWESKDGFYISLDGGAVFVNTPRKDNSNFFADDGDGTGFASNNSLKSFDTDSTAGVGGGKIGYVFLRKPTESWLGENLRIEGSGNYFHSTASDAGSMTSPTGFGSFFVENLNGVTNNNINYYFGEGAPPYVTEKTNDYFYEGAGVIKTDYFLGKDHPFTLTPSFGFDFSHLGQHFQTDANGIYFGEGGNFLDSLDQEEKVNTDYYGLVFGLELRANVSKNFVMFLNGSITPQLAYSSYFGTQNGNFLSFNDVGDHADKFTFSGSLTGGFSYDFGPVIFSLSGGFRYWDYVATVKESEIPTGAYYVYPTGPSHLVSDTMLNPQVNASVVIPF